MTAHVACLSGLRRPRHPYWPDRLQSRRLRQSSRSGGGPRFGGGWVSPERQLTGKDARPRAGPAGACWDGTGGACGRASGVSGAFLASSSVSTVAVGRPMMAGFASASTTLRPPRDADVMITALGGSCCSSCCSTRNSRDRCVVRASESLAPTARELPIPHAVLRLIPSVIDSESLVPVE